MRVDLNADVGEWDYEPAAQQDAVVMPFITSANIACGGHAGTRVSMHATIELARQYGVTIGAHPGFDDRAGFGRVERTVSTADVETLVARQAGALAAIAAQQGVRVTHVKPHGALYNMAARDRALATAIARGVIAVDATMRLVGLAGSALLAIGASMGLRTVSEAFADRAYRRDGSLVPRADDAAVFHDVAAVASRAVSMVREQTVAAIDGSRIPIVVETVCVHGDTPGAGDMARAIRRALAAAGIEVAAPQS